MDPLHLSYSSPIELTYSTRTMFCHFLIYWSLKTDATFFPVSSQWAEISKRVWAIVIRAPTHLLILQIIIEHLLLSWWIFDFQIWCQLFCWHQFSYLCECNSSYFLLQKWLRIFPSSVYYCLTLENRSQLVMRNVQMNTIYNCLI